MSAPLADLIQALEAQNEVVGRARNDFLAKDDERKHFEATMIQSALGKSHAERTVNAQARPEWLTFHQALARAQAVYEFQKFKLEILDKEWLAQYLVLKSDGPLIKKQGA